MEILKNGKRNQPLALDAVDGVDLMLGHFWVTELGEGGGCILFIPESPNTCLRLPGTLFLLSIIFNASKTSHMVGLMLLSCCKH